MARQLLDLKPDLIVAQGTPGLAAARDATRTLPLIFADVTDPVGLSMGGKWLAVLKSLAPSTKQVAVLFNPPTAPYGNLYFRSVEAAAPYFGIQPSCMEVGDETDVERKLTSLGREPNSGLIVLLDAFTMFIATLSLGRGRAIEYPRSTRFPFSRKPGRPRFLWGRSC